MKFVDLAIENTKNVTNQVTETGKTFLYAGLGTFTLVEENTKKAFDTLVEKGQKVEKPKVIKTPEKVVSFSNRIKDQGKKMEEKVQDLMSGVLHRFGVPNRNEVQLLINRVESLTKKIDGLKA